MQELCEYSARSQDGDNASYWSWVANDVFLTENSDQAQANENDYKDNRFSSPERWSLKLDSINKLNLSYLKSFPRILQKIRVRKLDHSSSAELAEGIQKKLLVKKPCRIVLWRGCIESFEKVQESE